MRGSIDQVYSISDNIKAMIMKLCRTLEKNMIKILNITVYYESLVPEERTHVQMCLGSFNFDFDFIVLSSLFYLSG